MLDTFLPPSFIDLDFRLGIRVSISGFRFFEFEMAQTEEGAVNGGKCRIPVGTGKQKQKEHNRGSSNKNRAMSDQSKTTEIELALVTPIVTPFEPSALAI
ncbi:hypothetical protein F2Q69_00047102 [Brassica cretica]|uniref:Uncharacterized protein n=1 Tax=Brassica cretica TaxID=69181 RepID=A0A8S9PK39_BRACR|nr:hypothetical protein F2Q69_00047102 [Brassica cretica]